MYLYCKTANPIGSGDLLMLVVQYCACVKLISCPSAVSATRSQNHRYAAALLRMEYSLDMLGDILASAKLRHRYQQPKMMKLTRKLQVNHLVPYLMEYELVTESEMEELTQLTQKKAVLRLLRMLKQKGPLAHLYLTKALIDAKDNSNLHEDILKEILLKVDFWEHETNTNHD